jgi:hypothetical protein
VARHRARVRSVTTAHPYTPDAPPAGSVSSSPAPACRWCGCTTCATAPLSTSLRGRRRPQGHPRPTRPLQHPGHRRRYTSVLPPKQRRTAEATAQLVLTPANRTHTKIKIKARKNRPPTALPTGAPTPKATRHSRETPGQRPCERTPVTDGDDPNEVPTRPPPPTQNTTSAYIASSERAPEEIRTPNLLIRSTMIHHCPASRAPQRFGPPRP